MTHETITSVEALYLRSPHVNEDRTDSSQDALLVRIETSSGNVGWGEVDSNPLVAKAVIEAPTSHTRARGLRDVLIGQDPLDITRLWHDMYEATLYFGRSGAVIHAMAGVDIALWDLKGKILNKSVASLIGGSYVDRLRAYASHMFSFTPEETAKRAAAAASEGFTALKFGWEPFGADADLDLSFVEALRQTVGPNVDLMIDAGLAWDAKTAISRARSFEPYQLFWLEEPVAPDDLAGYARIAGSTSTRIAAGEEECEFRGFTRLMDYGRIDVVQIDITRTGITEALHIARLANDRKLQVANHNFTTDINTAAALHVLSSIPNALILEYCVEHNPMKDSLIENPIKLDDGFAVVPTEPGLGVTVSSEAVRTYGVATSSALSI